MWRRIRWTNRIGVGWFFLSEKGGGEKDGRGKIELTSPPWPVAAPDPLSINSMPGIGVVKQPFYE